MSQESESAPEKQNIIIEQAEKPKSKKTEKALQNLVKARESFQKNTLPKIKEEAAVRRDHKKQTVFNERMQKLEVKLSTLKVAPKVEAKPEVKVEPETTRKQKLKKYIEPESESESESSESSDDEIIIVKKKKKQIQKTPKAKYTVPKPIQEKFVPPPPPPPEPEIRFY